MSDLSTITVQRAFAAKGLPSALRLKTWAASARGRKRGGITLRIVDAEEGLALNTQWRGKAYATNVLSFPFNEPGYLGDIVLCAEVVAREAAEQGKALHAHWAHMVVHGVLHLLGHDHIENDQAEVMETLERTLLAQCGFSDPYAELPATG